LIDHEYQFLDTVCLKPHPLNEKVYGATIVDPDLKRSIERFGILQPLVVNGDVILSGHNRWMAAMELGFKQVPVTNAGLHGRPLSELEAEAILIESNRQRVKTAGQIARETAELCRIEQALAAERMKAGTPVSQGPIGSTRDIVATKTGQGSKTVEKQIAIVKAANAGNPRAQAALAALDKDEISISAAHRMVTEPTAHEPSKKAQPVLVPPSPTRVYRETCEARLAAAGIIASVTKDNKTGKFDLRLVGLTKVQLEQLMEILEATKSVATQA
jgi:ParB-like chromosome segregation protein Spo0J